MNRVNRTLVEKIDKQIAEAQREFTEKLLTEVERLREDVHTDLDIIRESLLTQGLSGEDLLRVMKTLEQTPAPVHPDAAV